MVCVYAYFMDDNDNDCEIRLETATVVGGRRRRAFGCGSLQSRVQLILYQLGCRLSFH